MTYYFNGALLPFQELIATGTANIFGSFFSCYPIAASVSRSSVQDSAGGKTQVTRHFDVLFVCLFVCLFFIFFLIDFKITLNTSSHKKKPVQDKSYNENRCRHEDKHYCIKSSVARY